MVTGFWKFADQKVNGFGPAHIEKSHLKLVFGCIFRQSLMKYGRNKSIKENSLRPWVLIPEDNRHSTVTQKIPLFSIEPVAISYTHYWVHWFLLVNYFISKNCLDWDIFHYFYFFTIYIVLLFYRLIPSVFHKTLSKYTPKNSFKMRFFYMSRAKYVHYLVCKLPN
jgi:hypothetical protein